ncbi:MAG: hypothetical protein Unbinned3891contig1000_8 [Prokaryotic dsDNA virus sp.]|nr:MAG: hypothetical protein Unbinned3891contig1000_8 [Prokaryotic dsDNA virus sp.]|tara:strand:+ start:22942 stop:23190 length:249 start_codon:yes stop_codon:yes gene_type:complete
MSELSKEDFLELKEMAEDAKQEHARAEGEHAQLLRRLKDDFDCKDEKQGRALLTKLRTEQKKAAAEYKRLESTYKKKWKNRD